MSNKPDWLPSFPEIVFSLIALLVLATLAQGAHRCFNSQSSLSLSCIKEGVEAQIQHDLSLFQG